tara:strand:- start:2118 stop:3422 length:1305 start_codon:yes stop_codon:yes gene_type:complete
MDLFQHQSSEEHAPLAHRLRPKSLADFLGQSHIFGKQHGLKEMILNGYIPNLILWGPPGVGKTTFAKLLSSHTDANYLSLNAVSSGAKELRSIGEAAKQDRNVYGKNTLVFVDEVHRFNRAQQDVLLPYIERGDFVFIGATTENPSFQLNRALLSRCKVLVFERLKTADMQSIHEKVLRLWGKNDAEIFDQQAKDYLLRLADGDARAYINNLEYLENYMQAVKSLDLPFSVETLKEVLQQNTFSFDRNEDHYDLASALIKSIRGSCPDAAVYYLARLLEGGEDPLFIARRLVIAASEDIGNADPKALQIAVAGFAATEKVGLPEAAINLAQVTTYLASAPKSNRSYLSLKKAQALVREKGSLKIPMWLRNAPTTLMKNLGYGQGYQYAHDQEDAKVEHSHMPKEIENHKLYEPSNRGYEKYIHDYLEFQRSKKP